MHAGPFSVNRRRRAQNGTGAAAFGGVGREISKIHIPISHDVMITNCQITAKNELNRPYLSLCYKKIDFVQKIIELDRVSRKQEFKETRI